MFFLRIVDVAHYAIVFEHLSTRFLHHSPFVSLFPLIGLELAP